MMENENKVLKQQFASRNFYQSDLILKNHLSKILSKEVFENITPILDWIGKTAATEMDSLSIKADKCPPQLNKRDAWGENIDEIEFHPAYWRLVEIAAQSKMFSLKWNPENQQKYAGNLNKISFAVSSIYAMAETGVYCPLCMTDGVAVLINKYCNDADKSRLLPSIYAKDIENMKTGAMFLTEKAGGSDVGANLVKATHWKEDLYLLNGEKWFCSNANADIIFVLARTNNEIKGTRGLSIFLVEKKLPNGTRNPMNIIRLKDKLGVKSMASAEIILTDTVGKLIGNEFEGFKVMTEMINLSRVYNSVAALSASRRAIVEAYQFVLGRFTFGKSAIEHPLIRRKLEELGALHLSNFYLVWRAIESLDKEHDENETNLLRILTPMCKKWSAAQGVYMTREAMELMGGIGYIEDQVMPKIMRDIMVLPIWEGAGNIMTLDMLRASIKSNGLQVMFTEIQIQSKDEKYGQFVSESLTEIKDFAKLLMQMDEEQMQVNAEPFFEKLTHLFQVSLLLKNRDVVNAKTIDTALEYLVKQLGNISSLEVKTALSKENIEELMGWEV